MIVEHAIESAINTVSNPILVDRDRLRSNTTDASGEDLHSQTPGMLGKVATRLAYDPNFTVWKPTIDRSSNDFRKPIEFNCTRVLINST
jgi:hypothetical protein